MYLLDAFLKIQTMHKNIQAFSDVATLILRQRLLMGKWNPITSVLYVHAVTRQQNEHVLYGC